MTVNVPKKLSTLIELCASKNVAHISFHPDGNVASMTFAGVSPRPVDSAVKSTGPTSITSVTTDGPPPQVRKPSANELAVMGFNYNPNEDFESN